MMGWQHARWAASAALIAFVCLPATAAEPPPASAEEQLLAAMNLTAGAERAARLAEVAGQKVVDAVRAERRAMWLARTEKALRHDRREAVAARRGAEVARLDRAAKDHAAESSVTDALIALDQLSEARLDLDEPHNDSDPDLQRPANRVVQAVLALQDAALPVRETLQEVNAVRVRLELSGDKISEERSQRVEEAVARRRLKLSDAIDDLIVAAQRLQVASELMRGADGRSARRTVRGGRSNRFGGLGGGIGAGFAFDVGGKKRVDRAHVEEVKDSGGAVTQRLVRVDKTGNDLPHVMIEGHYLFSSAELMRMPWCRSAPCLDRQAEGRQCWLCEGGVSPGRFAAGPFLAVQPGEDFIDAVGAGVMLGVRADALRAGDGFNLGLGYFADPNTQVLADGFSENRPPPSAENQVRYKDTTKSGIMLLMSYGF